MRLLSIAVTVLLALGPSFPTEHDSYLLIDKAELDSARSRAERLPWAKRSLERLMSDADRDASAPIDIPDRGGQWTHWYSCPRDGAPLRTISATGHRCSACGTMYSGEPYDSVVLSRTHSRNSAAIRTCALAFRLGGTSQHAARAAAILLAYADRYRGYRLHNIDAQEKIGGGRIMAQTLDESVWLIPAAWGYALVRDTLSEAQRTHIEGDLLLPAADVIRADKRGIHNIQCWKNSAVGLVGYVTGREALVREAIDDPERGFLVQIERGVTEDGLWWEGSLGYHEYTMQALWPLAEAARHAGRNLYTDRYRRLWDAPISLALPNGDPPGFNDSQGESLTGMADLYEIAYARYQRPEYGHLVAATERESLQALLYGRADATPGPYVPSASSLLREAGFGVLRSGATAVAVRFGRHGGGHGHPDKLNVVTFGGGRGLGLDPGSINYGVPLHKEWYRSTIAHNTVSVDRGIQAAQDGSLEMWAGQAAQPAMSAVSNGAYPGVTMRRTVRLSGEGRIEDRFECGSDSEHEYDWAFHVPGSLSSSLELVPMEKPPGGENGYQHIRNPRWAATDGPFRVVWDNGGVTLTLEVAGVPGTVVITGTGPGRNPTEQVPMLIVRRRARTTVFEVLHTVGTPAPR